MKLNRKQAQQLIEAVKIYNWVVNSCREKRNRDTDSFCSFIYSNLQKGPFREWILQEEDGTCFLKDKQEHRILSRYINAYDTDVFWTVLAMKLGERDFAAKNPSAYLAMNRKELILSMDREIREYEEEFSRNGILNLFLLKEKENTVNEIFPFADIEKNYLN